MKRLLVKLTPALVLAALLSLASNLHAQGAQMDAPHNLQGCLSCHDMSTWSEPNMIPGGSEAVYDNICVSCHNGVIATAMMDTHSSATTSGTYGTWSVGCTVCHNQHKQDQAGSTLGSNGRFIRSKIDLSRIEGLVKTGYKPVKLLSATGPNSFADGDSVKDGICEVCHTQTLHFRNDDSLADEGTHTAYIGIDCMACHVHGTGFTGTAGAAHSTFIADDNQTGNPAVLCSSCHTGYDTAPETAHSSCTTCHTSPPTLAASTFPNANGEPDWDSDGVITMRDNLISNGYNFDGSDKLRDAENDYIDNTPGVFTAIKCGFCHVAKPDALQAGNHGGHVTTDWNTATPECNGCHTVPGSGVVAGIHGDDCTFCHADAAGGDYTRISGTDGDATLASGKTGGCLTCHPDASFNKPFIHHENNSTNVVYNPLTDCVTCHTGSYAGDHFTASLVGNDANCTSVCHTATAPTNGNNVPVDPSTPGGDKIHDSCSQCHTINAVSKWVELVTPSGTVTTLNPGTAATNDGGGTCSTCHTAYALANHAHDHSGSVTTTGSCIVCHDNGAGTSDARTTISASPFVGAGDIHSTGCSECHAADGSRISAPKGDATVNGGAGGSCAQCHSSSWDTIHANPPAMVDHSARVGSLATCTTLCHTGTGGTAAIPTNNLNDMVHDGCATCHNTTTGTLLTKAVANVRGYILGAGLAAGNCGQCHSSAYFGSHTHNHAASVTTTASCLVCHDDGTGTSDGRTTISAAPFVGAGDIHGAGCTECHNVAVDGALQSSPKGDATVNAGAGGACADCHTASWDTAHTNPPATVDHSTRVANLAACTTNCHTGTGGVAAIPTNNADDMIHDGCATCHDTANGNLKAKATANVNGYVLGASMAAGDCGQCHSATYFDSHIHGTDGGYVSHAVSYLVNGLDANAGTTGDNDTSQSGEQGCAACHTPVGALTTWTGISNEHNVPTNGAGPCATCHSSARNSNISIGYTDVPDVIATAAATSCDTCHEDKTPNVDHGSIDHVAGGRVTGVAQCTGCHDQGGLGTNDHYLNTIHNASGNGCGTCHVSAGGGGALHDYSGGGSTLGDNINYEAINLGAGGSCVDCHTPYSADFQNAHNTVDHQSEAAADALTATANCTTTCHDGSSLANIITNTHNGTCTNCHTNTTTDGRLKSGINGDASGHTIDSASTCADCHTDYSTNYQTAHDVGDHTGIAGAANCTTTCHDGTSAANIVTNTHLNLCVNCHSNSNTNGTLISSLYGNASNGAGTCTFCHTAYGTDFQNHAVSDHKTKLNADVLTATATCTTNCHDGSTLANILGVTHTGTCANCHTNIITNGTLKTAANGNAASHTLDSQSACADCHTAYASNFDTAHDVKDHTGMAALASCTTNCHDGSSAANIITNTHKNTCTSCHTNTTTDGKLKVGVSNGDATQGAGDCAKCHGATGGYNYDTLFETAHDVKDHTGIAGAASCTTTCHDGTSAANIITNTHNNTCASCHTNTTTDGKLKSGLNGDATGGAGACASCHTAYNTSFETGHQNENHTEVTATTNATPTLNCGGCHTGDLIGGAVNHGLSSQCENCHSNRTTDGTFTSGPLGDATSHTVGAASECIDCHASNYFDSHTHGTGTNHDVLQRGTDLSNGSLCNSCHGNFTNNWAGISALHTLGCGQCHNSTRNTNVSGYTDVPDVIATGTLVGCLNCHSDRAAAHMDHLTYGGGAVTGTGSASCLTCHDPGNAANNTQYVEVIHDLSGGGCGTCHVAAGGGGPLRDYSGSGGNIGEFINYETLNGGAGGSCIACHGSYNTDFFAGHKNESHANVTGTASCQTCHANAALISSVHANNCNNCHDANGLLNNGTHASSKDGATSRGTATGHTLGSPSTCADCHSSINTAYTNHAVGDHSGVGGTASCQTCHTGASIIVNTHTNTCSMCHTAVTGVLKTGTVGDASGHTVGNTSTCANCHATRAADYTNHSVKDHKTTGLQDALITWNVCDGCHTDTTAATIVSSIHNNTCANCHTAVTGVLRTGANGDAATHTINTQSTCAGCHSAYNTDFYTGHKNEDHTLVQATTSATPTLDCAHCHVGDLINGTPNHLGNCGDCHTGAANGEFRSGPLGSATGHTIGTASKCINCHGAFVFANHSHVHTIVFDTTSPTPNDWSQETQTPCSNCHNDGGDLLTSFASIKTEHLNSCNTCHNATRDTSKNGLNSIAATIQDIVDANYNPTNCRLCHRDKQDEFSVDATHGTIDHVASGAVVNTGATWCTDCHDSGGVGGNDYYINTIHKVGSGNTCGVCHQSAAGAGPLREPWETTNPAGGACTDCHGSNFLTLHGPSIDHTPMLPNDNTSSITGGRACYLCHDQSLTYDIQKWVHNSTCSSCHDSFGTLINSAAGHDGGTNGGTDGGGNCRTCHTAPGIDKASHHATPEAQSGMCQFCHFPDRTKVDRTNQMPKQLECGFCHIASTAATFKVNSAAYTPDMENSGTWSSPSNNPGMVMTEVVSHTIAAAGTAINVYDYEACFSCHTDAQVGGAPEVLPFHGRPGGYAAGTSHLANDPNIPWEEPMSMNSITSIKYHIMWKAPGRTTTTKTGLDIMARPSTQAIVDINGNPFPDWWAGRQFAKGGTAQTWTKNNYDEALSQTIKTTFSTIPWDRFNTTGLTSVKIPAKPDLAFPMPETVYVVRATHNGQLGSNQLIVWAKNLDPDATLTVVYNGSSYPMTKLAGEQNKFEANITDGTYVNTVRVYSSNVSASSDVTVPVDNLAPPASIDYVTVTKADWTGGSLTVWATHTNNDGVNTFKASYNGVNNQVMTWNAGFSRYEVTFAVTFAGGDVLVDSNDADTGTNTKPVTDLDAASDSLTFTKADWDTPFNGQLTVWFTHTNNNGVKTYQCDYNGSNNNVATWSAVNTRYELILTGTTRPFPGGSVRCYSYDIGGADQTTAVTNVSPALDTLTITKADWDDKSNGTLYVWATHSENNGVKTYQVDYNGSNGNTMTWNGVSTRYEVEINVVGTPFPAGQALVYSNNSGGDRVFATVDSISSTTADHINTGYVTWPATGIYCINCHSPLGLQDVIDDIHMGNCLECHTALPATQGNYKVGQPIPNNSFGTIFPVGGGDCDSCHETFTSNPTWYINDADGSCSTTDCYTAGEDTWQDESGGTVGQYDAGVDTQISDGGDGWTTGNGTAGDQAGRSKTWHHHKSTNAQKGNCTHCHNNGKQWTQVPKQAPCAYCHIDGSTDNFQLRTFNFDVATQFNQVINAAPSNTHDIPDILADGVKVRPYDFGVCFDCHDGSDTKGGVQSPMVYPYHATGMALDVTKAPAQGGIPLDLATGYQEPTWMYDAKKGLSAVGFNNTAPWETPADGRSNDLFWAYSKHPGRGGIIGSASTIPNGSFNLLFPYMNKRTKYYQTGTSFNGETFRHIYEAAPYSTQYELPNATVYTDPNGDQWTFNQSQTINYLETFNRLATPVSVTVPVLPDKPLPPVPDKVSITRADHNSSTNKLRVWAKTTLSTDWYLKATGTVTVTYNASTYPMIWNDTDSRWEYWAIVADPGSVQVDSTMGATGTASANTVPTP